MKSKTKEPNLPVTRLSKFSFRSALLITAALIVLGLVLYVTTVLFDGDLTQRADYAPTSTLPNLKQSLDKAEQAKNETELLRERLIEQGYSEEVLDGLLASGAERAVQLPYIAAVKELYGAAWNLPLNVGDFTLVDLYIVGDNFVVGFFEDITEEYAIWLHMSTTEDYDKLRAGLAYEVESNKDTHVEYLDANDNIRGFAFWVNQNDEKNFSRYVATASFAMTADVIDAFLGSIVDGNLGKTGYEPE